MILDETRERFIKAIVKQVDPERIAEIHFFAPIRQAGVESGVAVIAATEPEAAPPAGENEPDPGDNDASVVDTVVSEEPEQPDEPEEPERSGEPGEPEEAVAPPETEPANAQLLERHVIYTARYRLTLKGVDRGKWETNVTAEADAPIITVDAVVRGVQRRAGDVDDPTRMNGDEIRAALPASS